MGLDGGLVASVLGCESYFLPARDQTLEKPPAPHGAHTVVTSLGDSGKPATPPISGAESQLPPAHCKDSQLSTGTVHLRAGTALGVPIDQWRALSPDGLSILPGPKLGAAQSPGGARRSHARPTLVLTSAQGSRSPPRASALLPIVPGRRPAKAFGNLRRLQRCAPSSRPISSLSQSQSCLEPAAARNKPASLSILPSPRLPRHRYLQPQPGAGEAAKGGGEGSKG